MSAETSHPSDQHAEWNSQVRDLQTTSQVRLLLQMDQRSGRNMLGD